jgi:cytochrome b involved in lipid metabolism
MSKTFSQSDVASHQTSEDLWIIVDEDVYDLTKFQDEHPGKLNTRVKDRQD